MMTVRAPDVPAAADGDTRPEVDQRRGGRRASLIIFGAVNLALAVTWLGLVLAEVPARGLWVWPVVSAVWLLKIFFVDGRSRTERTFSADEVEWEMRRRR